MKHYLTAVLLLSFSLSALAAQTVSFGGDITPTSMTNLLKKIDKAIVKDAKKNPAQQIITIRLSSGGGNIYSALRFVREVESRNQGSVTINTQVRSSCESACTILYTAGHNRQATRNARFGFHSPKIESRVPRDRSRDEIMQKAKDDWMDAVGAVDPGLVGEILRRRMLEDEDMTYFRGHEAVSGYVTEIVR
jgi:hypothetical protein